MIIVIAKKENRLKSTIYTKVKFFKIKGLGYLIYILINKIKKYEIEVLEK